jgi:hypothetical protein
MLAIRLGRDPRIFAGLIAELLLLWAYLILRNIWTNDDSALAILGFAVVPSGLGLLAAGFALRGRFGLSKSAHST